MSEMTLPNINAFLGQLLKVNKTEMSKSEEDQHFEGIEKEDNEIEQQVIE